MEVSELELSRSGELLPATPLRISSQKASECPTSEVQGRATRSSTVRVRSDTTSMSRWITIPGSSAFSDFRLANLQRAVGAEAVRAIWVHYAQLEDRISPESHQILTQLLDYGIRPVTADDECGRALLAAIHDEQAPASSKTRVLYVTPRRGTISPWSSKATSIAHVSGLGGQVKRIERGVAIAVTSSVPYDGDDDDEEIPFADLLRDRMTQVSV